MKTPLLLLTFLMFALTSNGQIYFYDICQGSGGGSVTTSNNVTITCASFQEGTGVVDPQSGTEDPDIAPEGTEIRTTFVSSIRPNDGGWTNYVGLSLHFDTPVLPRDDFWGADVDNKEQMTIFGFNSNTGQWVMPVLTLGATQFLYLDSETFINDFPLPAGAPSPSGSGLFVPTVNSNHSGLQATDIRSQFFVDFGDDEVTDLIFLYARDVPEYFNEQTSRSVFVGPNFELLEDLPASDLSLTKDASTPLANVNDPVTFTLSLTNNGPDDVETDIVVNDMLPSGYTYVGSSASHGSYNQGTGDWTIPQLSFGVTATLDINTTINASGNYLNQAEVTVSENPDPDSDPASSFGQDDLTDGVPDDDEASASVDFNTPPDAVEDNVGTLIDETVVIDVSTNDTDIDGNLDPTSYTTGCVLCDGPNNGTLTNNGDGTFTYVPTPGFTGNDSFTYQVCDATGVCDTATVFISVNWDPACASDCNSDFSISDLDFCLGATISVDGTLSTSCQYIDISTYTWDFDDGTTSSLDQLDHTYTTAGTYNVTLTIETDSACIDDLTMVVQVNDLPNVQLSLPSTSCLNDVLTLNGGVPSGGTYSGPGVSGTTFTASQAGIGTHDIIYNYTDGSGCSGADTASISVFGLPTVTLDPVSPLCLADSPVSAPIGSPAGGVYSGSGYMGATIDPAALGIGSYSITYTYTDTNGCADDATSNFTVTGLDHDSIYVVICDGDTYTLGNGQVVSQPGTYVDTMLNVGLCGRVETTIISLSYNTSDTLHVACSDTSVGLPVFNIDIDLYDIDVNVTTYTDNDLNIYGCDSVTFYYLYDGVGLCPEECDLFIPSAFTPNGDGLNDLFHAISICPNILISFEMRIYNRWGEEVFTSTDITKGWDGRFKGVDCPIDVFTYIVKFDHTLGEEMKSGVVTLIR